MYDNSVRQEAQANTRLSLLYRRLFSAGFFIAEENEPYFQERLVQIIWNERLVYSRLQSSNGDSIRVIHTGIWNIEAGPDFRDAELEINGTIKRGSVEIHLEPDDWKRHRHGSNSDYEDVILHVVWHNPNGHLELPAGVPVCPLVDQITLPLPVIMERFDPALYPYASQVHAGPLAHEFATLPDQRLADLFTACGVARMMRKARDYAMAIEMHGLDGAAYQGLGQGLGYKENTLAFSILTSAAPLDKLARCTDDDAIAVVLGAAGLLPDPSQTEIHPDLRPWVRNLWQRWWPHRDDEHIPTWSRKRMRPLNSPERRVIALHHILRKSQYRLGQSIVATFASEATPQLTLQRLITLFELSASEQGSKIVTFSTQLPRQTALVGRARALDLVVNMALPLYLGHCLLGEKTAECEMAKAVLLSVPRLQSNRRFQEAIHRFFVPPSRGRQVIKGACAQQGLLHLNSTYNQRRPSGRGEMEKFFSTI